MRALILGYTSIVARRVLPAMALCDGIDVVDIASRSKSPPPDRPKPGAVFSSYEEALARSDAQLVYVSLPNSEHVRLVLACLAAGKHVIVDKPAALALADTEKCLEEAKQRSLLLAEATVFSHHPQVAALRAFADEIGPLTHISARLIIPPMPAENFRNIRALGGGCLLDMGPYAAAVARLFAPEPLVSLAACAALESATFDVDVGFSVLARFADGIRYSGEFSFESEYQNRLELVGARGSVSVERIFSMPPDMAPVWHVRQANKPREVVHAPADAFRHFLEAAMAAIDTGAVGGFAADMLGDARFRETISDSLALWSSKT